MKICIDACTLILLAKASVLETVLIAYEVVTSKQVYEEVLAGKKKMFPDALLIERLADEKKLNIVFSPEDLTKRIKQDFAMAEGEASVISCGLSQKGMIIATDNKQGRKAALVNGLPLVGSVDLVISLNKKKKINKKKAEEALRILKDEGWFHPYIIEKASEDLQ